MILERGVLIMNIQEIMSIDKGTEKTALSEYKDLLSVNDLAEIFEVSKQTIYKELNAGKFGEPITIGREYKIPKLRLLQQYFEA